MRSPNKSRSRNKNQNRRTSTNIINRVFDSSGPEGKVRGTPQQVIEKYQMLARDAQLSGDRVAAENFKQHAEHYTRLLVDAMREQAQRRELQEAQQRDQQKQHQQQQEARPSTQQQQAARPALDPQQAEQPDVVEPAAAVADTRIPGDAQDSDSGLVETPEGRSRRKKSAPRRQGSGNEEGQAAQ